MIRSADVIEKLKADVSSDDFIARDFSADGAAGALLYVDGMSDKLLLEQSVVKPLLSMKWAGVGIADVKKLPYGEEIKDIERYKGMYLQFSDLGLVTCVQYSGGNVVYYGHHPKAEWAVAHHDRKAAEARARAEAEERRHRETLRSSQRNIVIGWALGLVTALVSFALAHIGDLAALMAR